MKGRRAFTLLETMLAASLGAALVLMVVGLMGFMDRAEARQAKRLEQMDAMSRIHRVMSRTFSSLVVADPNSGPAFQRAVAKATEGEPLAQPEPPARVLLGADESTSFDRALRRAKVAGGGAVQRLEVVLERPPVPRNFARGMSGALGSSVQSNRDERDDENRPILYGPLRGVFELRPDQATLRIASAPPADPDDPRVGWTLWWRPLIDERSLNMDPTEDPEAVPIASGLAMCTWRAFINRERSEKLRVVSTLELPAYMEMEVRTLGGQHANWMFEVQWSVGGDGSEEEEPGAEETGGRATERAATGTRGRNRDSGDAKR